MTPSTIISRYDLKSVWLLLFLAFSLNSQTIWEDDGSVLLPRQKTVYWYPGYEKQLQYSTSRRWINFTQKYGKWRVLWNEATGTPHRAFGRAIQIPGYFQITEANVKEAAREFLIENAALLKIDPQALKFIRAIKINNRWYVSYVQVYHDIEVLFSEIEIRLFHDGKVMALGIDFYSDIDISTQPTLSYPQAMSAAITGLNYNERTDEVGGEGRLYILPFLRGENLEYHLVYQVSVRITRPVGNYIVLVDAHTGEILWRHNLVRYADISGTVKGQVQLVQPTDPFTVKSFADLFVSVGGELVRTDSLGAFTKKINSTVTVSATLWGPWVNVNRRDGSPDASFSTSAPPGSVVDILWTDSNSHPAERDAFYHTNLIHNFITELDPAFTATNYVMPCAVNINDECNAFWDGNGINFFNSGGGCANMAQIASVVYHEYTHGINQRLYQQLGAPFGMVNGAVNEGMADVQAVLIEDNPRMGRGFTGLGSVLRDLENNRKYPEDVVGEVHRDGLIIGGAFWDLRMATSLKLARRLSHFAKYGLPDDPRLGYAFAEWFLETLIVDDDDGDLDNGTPHFEEINQSFNKHGIGTVLFLNLSFIHTPLSDTPDTLNAYPVDFHLEGSPFSGGEPDSIMVHFSNDNFQTEQTIPALPVGNNQFRAEIPHQPAGSLIRYYISAYDPIGRLSLVFPSGAPEKQTFEFLVGFETRLMDSFESDTGWMVGAIDDNAETGQWERADPEATTVNNLIVQPELDHTSNGTHCFVTDGTAGSGPGSFDVDDGKTTLFSPVLNLAEMTNPVIRYYKWYSNDKGAAPGQDFWIVEISNDGGQTWVTVENTNESTIGWEKVQFQVTDYLLPTDGVQLRFIASDFYPGSLVEALIDDFELLSKKVVTAILPGKEQTIPEEFALHQNYPNPFNPSTTIEYSIPRSARVVIKVYNTLGQEVKTLLNQEKVPGSYAIIWDGRDNQGNPVASGIYLYKMVATPLPEDRTPQFTKSYKLVFLK